MKKAMLSRTFNCRILSVGRMPISRCLQNQEGSVAFWGDLEMAMRCESCPCDQGLKIKEDMDKMANKKGTCTNCGRFKTLMGATGLCGVCHKYAGKKAGIDRERALEDAIDHIRERAEQFVGQHYQEDDTEPSLPMPMETGVNLIIPFKTERDMDLYRKLESIAEGNRREPEQQVLWMLEDAITAAEMLDVKM